jgi:small-conductance mechanosensitive channel/archaellum component FlaC
MRFLLFLLIASLIADPLTAQTAPENSPPPAEVLESEKLRALRVLSGSILTQEKDRNTQRDLFKKATSEEQKKEITAEIERLNTKIKELKQSFASTATGINTEQTTTLAEEAVSLNEEIRSIFQPAIQELRDATAQPREIEALKTQVRQWKAKVATAQSAVNQIDQLLTDSKSEDVTRDLNTLRKTWQKNLIEAQNSLTTTSVLLEERKSNSPSVVTLLTTVISTFWKNRGLSLIIALLGFVATFLLFRHLYRLLRRYSPFHIKHHDSIAVRLVDVIANAFIFFTAFLVIILILYLRNDWLLLTVVTLLFIGLIWASRTTLPAYFEQLRLIVNLGNVREGERVIYEGLPWRVDTLHFFCVLRNPDLNGATLRLPAKALLPYNSRACLPKEPWFPTRIDDWVLLDDGVMGKIVQQTPEQVVIVKLGGSFKTYPTLTFLSKNPENISPQFSVGTTFGLDYRYQAIATTTIPAIIEQKVLHLLIERFGKDAVRSVMVEFSAASPSSLDFRIAATISGEFAPQYYILQRMLQRGAVEACNENNWVIPFPQLTLHQA